MVRSWELTRVSDAPWSSSHIILLAHDRPTAAVNKGHILPFPVSPFTSAHASRSTCEASRSES
jgi:hypothetical protein